MQKALFRGTILHRVAVASKFPFQMVLFSCKIRFNFLRERLESSRKSLDEFVPRYKELKAPAVCLDARSWTSQLSILSLHLWASQVTLCD